jgi:hypothetical protein
MSNPQIAPDFFCHEKVVGLSEAACGVWAKGLSWVAAKKSKGRISRTAAGFLKMSPCSIRELVKSGLWDELADGSGWEYHNFNKRNPATTPPPAEPTQMDLLTRIAILEDVVDIAEPLERERIGYDWWKKLTNTRPDLYSWRREFREFGARSEYEREMVALHWKQTAYTTTGPSNPGHALKYWDEFVAGPRGLGFKPTSAKAPGSVSSSDEIDLMEMPEWLGASHGR